MRLVVALVLSLVPQQSVGLGLLVAVDQLLKHPIVTAQIRGRVFDEYGASIPDASVSFEPVDQRSGLTRFGAVADSRGRFDFAGIRPGTYRITCKALGFETTIITEEVVAGEENDITVVVRRRQSQTAANASRSSSP